jgi:hypothetical protein
MDPSENNNPSTPFRDLSGANAKTRKAELQKARHAAMSEEKRNEINRKHREARQRKKAQSTQPESSTGDIARKSLYCLYCTTFLIW